MDKACKKFDETRQIINRIRGKNRPRPSKQTPNFVQMELPPIINSLSPNKNQHSPMLSTSINSPFRSHIDIELDSIITETLSNFKNQKINKIIFTTPITPRMGKTYYPNKEHTHQQIKTHSFPKQYTSIDSHTPLDSHFSVVSKPKHLASPYGPQISIKFQSQSVKKPDNLHRYGNWNPQAAYDKNKARNSMRARIKDQRKMGNRVNQRFSPWNNEEGQLEMTI